MEDFNPVTYAAKAAGSKYKLAQMCGVTPQAVEDWEDRGRIPDRHVLTIERKTEGKARRHRMRPDLYPPSEYARLRA